MADSVLRRIGVSLEDDLLEKFDDFNQQKGYPNRSESIRDLIRSALLQHTWDKDEQIVAGTIMLLYDHHKRHLLEDLTAAQHERHEQIMATTHFHLDETYCLELIVVKGKAQEIQALSNTLASFKGVAYSGLQVSPLEHL